MLPTQSTPNVARKAEIVFIIKALSQDSRLDTSRPQDQPWWRPLLIRTPRVNPQDGN
jgi:hypothetical protein